MLKFTRRNAMKKGRQNWVFIIHFLLLVTLSLFSACAKPEEEITKESPTISEEIKPPAALPLADASVKVPEPKNTEVLDWVKRLYKDSVTVDGTRFLVG